MMRVPWIVPNRKSDFANKAMKPHLPLDNATSPNCLSQTVPFDERVGAFEQSRQ
jgi:hypothetical protein